MTISPFPARPMNKLFSILSALLYLAGILLIFSISVGVLWGEIEASFYFTQSSSPVLELKCPLILSPRESGTINAVVANTTNEDTKPMVTSMISGKNGAQETSQILILPPGKSQSLKWTVDSSNLIQDRLILVNIIQRRYSDLEARQGTCGILVLSLFGLSGLWSFGLTVATGLLLIICGSILWLRSHLEFDEYSHKIIQASKVITGLTFAGLISAIFRWWGFILIFDGIAALAIFTAFTEIVLFPGASRR